MIVLPMILENKAKEKNSSMAGQMTLADLLGEDSKDAEEFRITMPKLPEFDLSEILQFEKEALGFYLSGHPLDEFREVMNANITATSLSFNREAQTDREPLRDKQQVTVGGIITGIKNKITSKQQQMAFIEIEDMVGTIDVVVFPNTYQKKRELIRPDNKVFIFGSVDISDDANAKLIANNIYTFEEAPKELWLQFEDKDSYLKLAPQVDRILSEYKGLDQVSVYLKKEKAVKKLNREQSVNVNNALLTTLYNLLSEINVKVTYKVLKKIQN